MWNINVVALFLCIGSAAANIFEAETYDCIIRGLASKSRDRVDSFGTICTKIGSRGPRKLDLSGDVNSFVSSAGYQLKYGQTQLSIPLDLLNGSTTLDLDVDYGKRKRIQVSESKSTSGLEHRTGTYKIIVLRMSDTAGNSPTASTYKMGQDVFSDAYNLVRKPHDLMCYDYDGNTIIVHSCTRTRTLDSY